MTASEDPGLIPEIPHEYTTRHEWIYGKSPYSSHRIGRRRGLHRQEISQLRRIARGKQDDEVADAY